MFRVEKKGFFLSFSGKLFFIEVKMNQKIGEKNIEIEAGAHL